MVITTLITSLLSDEVIGLIRMVIADAPRFPSLAKQTRDAGRLLGIGAVTDLIADHSQRPRDARARAINKRGAHAVATSILDAAIQPMIMRGLMGEDLDAVRSDIRSHVKQIIGLFEASNALARFV